LHGETLTDALERGAIEVHELASVLAPAMRGVAAAHRHGVIHRDIKPDNIFLCRDQAGAFVDTKVLDFGISKLSTIQGQLNPRLTRTGAIMGTPYYMSPEQIRGVSDVDGRVDIYAFGVILYEALTGRVPFDGKTYSALVLEIATGVPRRPTQLNPKLPVGLEQLVLKAMAREADHRYPDLDALARELERFGGAQASESTTPARFEGGKTLGSSTTPFTSVAPALPVSRGPRYVAVAAAVVIAAGAAALWLGSRQASEPVVAEQPAHEVTPARAVAAEPPARPEPPAQQVAPVAPPQVEVPTQEVEETAAKPVAAPKPVAQKPAPPAAKDDDVRSPHRGNAAPHRATSERPEPPVKPSRPRGTGRSGAIAADEF
jgi:serine/threonine-protein kinase